MLNDIREAGFETGLDHIMLANERTSWRTSWTKEKSYRRKLIAHTHRIIMLKGQRHWDKKRVMSRCDMMRGEELFIVGATSNNQL